MIISVVVSLSLLLCAWTVCICLCRKSTFFNVLTKSQAAAENFPFCTIDPNESMTAFYQLGLYQYVVLNKLSVCKTIRCVWVRYRRKTAKAFPKQLNFHWSTSIITFPSDYCSLQCDITVTGYDKLVFWHLCFHFSYVIFTFKHDHWSLTCAFTFLFWTDWNHTVRRGDVTINSIQSATYLYM